MDKKSGAIVFFTCLTFFLITWSATPNSSSTNIDDAKQLALKKAIQNSGIGDAAQPSSNNNNNPKRDLPLRYEFNDDNLANSGLDKIRQSCTVADLERVAYFSVEKKQRQKVNPQQDGAAAVGENEISPPTTTTTSAADAAFAGIERGSWLFRNWCSRFTSLPSPSPDQSNKNRKKNRKKNKKLSNNKQNEEEENTSNDPLPYRLDADQLRSLFQNQVTLFVGDSVVRNHFVLAMARMCNEKYRSKCMKMMPTYEYDIVRPNPFQRGPLGCIPKEVYSEIMKKTATTTTTTSPAGKKDEQEDGGDDGKTSSSTTTSKKSSGSSTTSNNVDADNLFQAAEAARKSANEQSLTDCYKNGSFGFIPAPGLTTNREPKRSERKQFLRKGVITPLIRAEVNGSVFYYIPVNTPKQIARFGKWLLLKAHKSKAGLEISSAKTVFVSTGPHLSQIEMNSSISVLKPALQNIQRRLQEDSVVVLAETTHLLNGPAWYSDFVDGVMDRWRQEFYETQNTNPQTTTTAANNVPNTDKDKDKDANEDVSSVLIDRPLQVELVPQRFVTIGGYNGGMTVRESGSQETARKKKRTCPYYDRQHPGVECQEILTELMLLGAYSARARKLEMLRQKKQKFN